MSERFEFQKAGIPGWAGGSTSPGSASGSGGGEVAREPVALPPGVRAIRPGHAPSCSSAGSVVGLALVSGVAWAALLAGFAHRLTRWTGEGEEPGEPGDSGRGSPPGASMGPADAGGSGESTLTGPQTGSGRGGALSPKEPLKHLSTPSGSNLPLPRLRAEPFGGVLSLPGQGASPGALVFLDPEAVERARVRGVEQAGPQDPPSSSDPVLSAPTEAHVALTGRCPVRCVGCYTAAGPEGTRVANDEVRRTLHELAEMGVLEVAFGGGEAGLDDEVLALAEEARRLGMVPNLTTSGFGVDAARARAIAGLFGQVQVSLDGPGPIYRQIRGWDGAALGLAALRHLAEAGVRTGVNTVLARPLLDAEGALEQFGVTLRDAGAREWQWLRFKPAGRGKDAWARLAPAPTELDRVWPRLLAVEAATGLTMRIDCALVPFVAAFVPADRLAALGVYGCEGGRAIGARGAKGRGGPCSFAIPAPSLTPTQEPGPAPEASHRGMEAQRQRAETEGVQDLATWWREDPELRAWRGWAPRGPCTDCPARSVCRGGCHVVAGFLAGDPFAPDPECPRVRAWAETRATS